MPVVTETSCYEAIQLLPLAEHRRALPLFSAQTLSDFLVIGLEQGTRKGARSLREWKRAPKMPTH